MSKPNHESGGLSGKYIVSKADGSPVDPEAKYFVLRYDKDPHARRALETYAACVRRINPSLANDLWRVLDDQKEANP